MNKKFLFKLLEWPKQYITGADLFFLFDKTSDSRKAIVSRAVREGTLVRLRRDFYLIKARQDTVPVDTYEIAPLIYGPSYVSLHSALQYHGWIPESVPVTTSVTVKKSKEFETPIGLFSYSHIPVGAFSIGVNQIHQNQSTLFIADPWKAVADLIYVQKRFWPSIEGLSGDLRIEMEVIQKSDLGMLRYLSIHYPHTETKKVLKRLADCGH